MTFPPKFAPMALLHRGAPLAIALIVALASPLAAAPLAEGTPQPPTEGERLAAPFAAFSGLDKITGRIISFDVAIDETVQFGALRVTPRVCYYRPQTTAPQTSAFVEVDEITLDNKIRRIFTGWMFADSPGLHAVDHAVYDVWLTDCRPASTDAGATGGQPAAAPKPQAPAAPKPQAPAPKPPAASKPQGATPPAGGASSPAGAAPKPQAPAAPKPADPSAPQPLPPLR